MTRTSGSKVLSNLFWKFAERILAQVITFIVSIILARLLLPEDYGVVALVLVFINIANVFVSSGFGEALIIEDNADELEYSSIFWSSFGFAWILYFVIVFAAPWISKVYHNPDLIIVFRVLGLKIPLSSINTVQHAIVSKNLQFRRFFFSTLAGTLISGVVGIGMAYKGYGVWAIVFQYLVNSSIDTLVLLFTVKWHPRFMFSYERVKHMMKYGWNLMFSTLINTVYGELQSLIIGVWYTSADLAQYKRGNQFPSLFVNNVNTAISSVLFPVMAKEKDNVKTVKAITRQSLQLTSYIMFPIMTGLAVTATPLVSVLLTDKWLDCVPYLRICCACFVLQPLQTANVQAINAIGRSDVCLKMEIIKKIIGVALLFAAIPFGVIAIAYSLLASVIFSTIVSCTPNRKLIFYGYREQLKDIIQPLIYCVIMVMVVIPIQMLHIPQVAVLLLQILVGSVVYILASAINKNSSYIYLYAKLKIIKNKVISR